MSGADVAGLYAALAKVATRTPEQRAADRRSAAVSRAGSAMAAGRRYRTRSLPGARRYVNPVFHAQPRCDRGHFVRPDRECRTCRVEVAA